MNEPGKIGIDGIVNHPRAKTSCSICHGGGLLDDGHYAMMLVPCLCTGRCPPDVRAKLKRNYPKEYEELTVEDVNHVD